MTHDGEHHDSSALVSDGTCPSCQGFFAATDIVAAVPGSFVLYAGPLACLRYAVAGLVTPGDREQAAYLVLTENDIVLGRTEECILEAVDEIVSTRGIDPRVLFVFLSCDAILLGLDGDALSCNLEHRHPSMTAKVILIGGITANANRTLADVLRECCQDLIDDEMLDSYARIVAESERS